MQKWIRAASVLLLLPLTVWGQGFWAKKDFQQWSAKECSKLLNDSPWAKSRIIAAVFIQPLAQPSAVPGREMNPQLEYVAQLWSALPIRQAAVRQVQLGAAFSKLPATERKAAAERQAKALADKFFDRIAVRVEYFTNVLSYEQEITRYWQNRLKDNWKLDTFLNTTSGRYSPVDVQVAGGAGGEFEIVFPRLVNGEPIVRPTDKSFSIEFQSPTLQQLPAQRVLLEFKLKDMLFNGQPVF